MPLQGVLRRGPIWSAMMTRNPRLPPLTSARYNALFRLERSAGVWRPTCGCVFYAECKQLTLT